MKAIDFRNIHLLEGEFANRQNLVRQYLAHMDADRLLHTFRLNNQMPSEAEPLGGWEAPEIGLRGHFTGHFLSACARFGCGTGGELLRDKAAYIIDVLEECQQKNGYLSAFPEEVLDTLEKEEDRGVWAPYYTFHKILQGLIDCYRYLSNDKALRISVKMARYYYERFQKLSFWKIDGILRCTRVNPVNEYGGIGDALYHLYEQVEEPWILELAQLFDREYFTGNLIRGRDVLTDLHANTHLPVVLAASHRYRVTKEADYQKAVLQFYPFLKARTFVNGVSSSKAEAFIPGGVSERSEHWGKAGYLADALTGGESESCCAHNTERILEQLVEWTGSVDYLEHMDRLKYNAVLNSASKETGLSLYHQPMGTGVVKTFSEPYTSFWCCTASGVEAMSELQKNIYFEDGDSLLIQNFISSEVDWNRMHITQKSGYPDELHTTFTFHMETPREICLKFRADAVMITEGGPFEIRDGFASIRREFRPGETLTLGLKAELSMENLLGSEDRTAILYGNILLAAIGDRPNVRGLSRENLLDHLVRNEGTELSFTLTDLEGEKTVFIPLYRVENETYSVYLDLSNERNDTGIFTRAATGQDAYIED